ncbi:MAG: hypothetical protein H0V56_01490 [Chthoniobacterales bacterium]|nr:hypothetical protein [Chthoniobacterales bacterium]
MKSRRKSRHTPVEIEFDAERLIAALREHADALEGKLPLAMRTTIVEVPVLKSSRRRC